jgi:hypothetical protein
MRIENRRSNEAGAPEARRHILIAAGAKGAIFYSLSSILDLLIS